jgi:hypothetical protein
VSGTNHHAAQMENRAKRRRSGAIVFSRGRNLFQIAPAYDADGFVGVCDGQIVARAASKTEIMKALIGSGSGTAP